MRHDKSPHPHPDISPSDKCPPNMRQKPPQNKKVKVTILFYSFVKINK